MGWHLDTRDIPTGNASAGPGGDLSPLPPDSSHCIQSARESKRNHQYKAFCPSVGLLGLPNEVAAFLSGVKSSAGVVIGANLGLTSYSSYFWLLDKHNLSGFFCNFADSI